MAAKCQPAGSMFPPGALTPGLPLYRRDTWWTPVRGHIVNTALHPVASGRGAPAALAGGLHHGTAPRVYRPGPAGRREPPRPLSRLRHQSDHRLPVAAPLPRGRGRWLAGPLPPGAGAKSGGAPSQRNCPRSSTRPAQWCGGCKPRARLRCTGNITMSGGPFGAIPWRCSRRWSPPA